MAFVSILTFFLCAWFVGGIDGALLQFFTGEIYGFMLMQW